MADKTREKVLRYLVVIMLLESSLAAVLPDSLKWLESDQRWLLDKKTTSTVHKFWLRTKEGQSVINENIQIDTNKETEMFHVYPFDSADEAIILSDFKKNWTLIKLPKKDHCFLQNLNPITPPPLQLMHNIQKAIALNGTNSTIDIDINEKSSWKVMRRVLDRTQLTTEMKQLCQTAPIYEIVRFGGQVYVNGLKRQGRSPMVQRSACGSRVCCYYYKWYCKSITSNGCLWVKVKVYGCQTIVC